MKVMTALLIISVAWSQSLPAGMIYDFQTKDNAQATAGMSSTQVMVDGRNLKMKVAAGDGQSADSMIYRGDRKEMIVIDHDQKHYYLIDQKTARKLGQQVSQAMAEYEAMLKEMPPEQRAMAEQMMKSRMPDSSKSKPQIKKTNQRKKINGFSSVLYEAYRDGRKTNEFWVTDWKNVKGGRSAAESFVEMSEMIQHMTSGSPQGARLDSNTPLAFIKQFQGFPVLTREFNEDGGLKRESQLSSVKESKMSSTDFSPPAGYEKKKMMK